MSGTVSDLLKVARGEIGYSRWTDPKAGTKYGRWYAELTKSSYFGTSGVPYCAMYVSWCLKQAGVTCKGFPGASCGAILAAAKAAKKTVSKASAKAGDIVMFSWDGDSSPEHVGIIETVHSTYFTTIEGNTSSGSSGSQSNGGGVYRRTRSKSVVCAVIRPDFKTATATTTGAGASGGSNSSTVDLGSDLSVWGPKYTRELQRQRGTVVDGVISGQDKGSKRYHAGISGTFAYGSGGSKCMKSLQSFLIKKGYSCGSSGADGYYGPDTIKAHQRWLKANGYSIGSAGVDGYHGADTSRAMAKALKAGKYRA